MFEINHNDNTKLLLTDEFLIFLKSLLIVLKMRDKSYSLRGQRLKNLFQMVENLHFQKTQR